MSKRIQPAYASSGTGLADVLERVLDKGLVIAGDIKIKLVDIELLTIQIRLLIASVDKAREMGMDWWLKNPDFSSKAQPLELAEARSEIDALTARIAALEAGKVPAPVAASLPEIV